MAIGGINKKTLCVARGLGYLLAALFSFALGCIIGSGSQFKTHRKANDFVNSDLLQFPTTCNASVPVELVYPKLMEKIYGDVSPYKNFPPEGLGKSIRKQWLKGWGSHDSVFQTLVSENKPRVIIEVGTFLGASAIHMAYLSLEMELNTTVLCIDDFRAWPDYRESFQELKHINGQVVLLYQFLQNVLRNRLSDHILPIPFSSLPALQAFCKWGITADLIELDSKHDFHSTWMEINYAYPLLTSKGIMFGHGYPNENDNHGVKRAVDLFARIHNLRVETSEEHWILRSS